MTPSIPKRPRWPLFVLPLLALSLGLAQRPAHPAPQPTRRNVKQSAFVRPSRDMLAVPTSHQTRRRPNPAPSDPHLTYEVRFLDVDATRWREICRERLTSVHQQGDSVIGELDDASLETVLEQLMKANRKLNYQPTTRDNPGKPIRVAKTPDGKLISFPAARAFPDVNLQVAMTHHLDYFPEVYPKELVNAASAQATLKSVNVGSRLEISGHFAGGHFEGTAEIWDRSLIKFHNLTRQDRQTDNKAVEYQVPSTRETNRKVAMNLTEGSSLFISLGIEEKPTDPTGLAALARNLLSPLGIKVASPAALRERVLVITPRNALQP